MRKVVYQPPAAEQRRPADEAQEFDAGGAPRRASSNSSPATCSALGFRPDIIIGHHGWGEMLNLCDVWPDVPLLGYYEFFYHDRGIDVGFDPEFPEPPGGFARVRAKNAVNLLALNNPGYGQTPTRFQHSTYPDWAAARIACCPKAWTSSCAARRRRPRSGRSS